MKGKHDSPSSFMRKKNIYFFLFHFDEVVRIGEEGTFCQLNRALKIEQNFRSIYLNAYFLLELVTMKRHIRKRSDPVRLLTLRKG